MLSAKFNLQNQKDFVNVLKERVNDYFKSKGISKFGDSRLYWKTAAMLTLYIVPFVLILINFLPFWANWIGYVIMGIGMVGIGMSVMHDAIHGSYSSNKYVNKMMGFSMELLGGNSFNWKVQHNVLHHTYTNIPGMDEDISHKSILRLEPTGKWLKIHRFQHIYALPIYSLLTLSWLLWSDFTSLFRYNKNGMTKMVGSKNTTEVTKLFVFKAIYIFTLFILPIFILGISWWQVIVGYVIMQMVAGFIFSVTFQLAHVVEDTNYPLPDEDGNIENNWAVHQMHTTANFAKKSRFMSWFIGGLNYQIEHHLFPNISHVHYPKISDIVKNTAKEFKIPYHEYKSLRAALVSHLRRLKELGQQPSIA
jgi:linoleoyl-CoA desaturase